MTNELGRDYSGALEAFTPSTNLSTAHLSPNGYAGTRAAILSEEQVHWYAGLRQAEVSIRSLEDDLDYNRKLQAKAKALLPHRQRRVRLLRYFLWLSPLFPKIAEEFYEAYEIVANQQQELDRVNALIRDGFAELAAARAEHDRIVSEHPEVEQMSFEKRSLEFSPEVYDCRQARTLAAATFAAEFGLPESVGYQLAFDLTSDEQRRKVLALHSSIRLGLDGTHIQNRTVELLAQLPDAYRAEVLQQAAQIVDYHAHQQAIEGGEE